MNNNEILESITDPRYHQLTANQKSFVIDAIDQGLEVDFGYSGRFMYGKTCPAVRVDNPDAFYTPVPTKRDHMGKGVVIYIPR
jgi:hypothetical protein